MELKTILRMTLITKTREGKQNYYFNTINYVEFDLQFSVIDVLVPNCIKYVKVHAFPEFT